MNKIFNIAFLIIYLLSIKVSYAQNTNDQSSSFGVSIEVEVDNHSPYIKTQVLYTIRIIDSVGIITGQSFPPQENGYYVASLSEKPTISKRKINGKKYNLVEQKFAIIPNKSGKVIITPAKFEGVISQGNMQVKLISKEVILNVKEKPQNIISKGLPMFKNLEIIDSWEQSYPKFFKNQPTTRNITMIALGTIAEEIPDDINIKNIPDMTVDKTSSISKTSYFNDELMAVKEFTYTYFPNVEGNISIPSTVFSYWNLLNNETTDLIIKGGNFEVKEAEENTVQATNTNVFLTIAVDNKTPFLQGQVILTLKVFDAVDIENKKVEAPIMSDFIIYPLDSTKTYKQNVSGKSYVVTETKYALFPQKSGIITINPAKITMLTYNRELVSLHSNSLTINVLPKPQNLNTKYWLPAQNIELLSGFDSEDNEFETGKAIRQTIQIKAKGLLFEQLPDIEPENIDGIKTYVSHTQDHNEIDKNGITGIKSKTIIYLPYKEGNAFIPSVSLDWYNIATNEINTEKTPPKTILVIKSAEKEEVINNDVSYRYDYKFISFIMGLVVFLCSLILIIIKRIKRPKIKNLAAMRLWQACQANNAQETYKAFVAWGASVWKDNPPNNPLDIAKRLDNAELSEQVQFLIDCAYGGEYEWNGSDFLTSLKNAQNHLKNNKNIDKDNLYLPELYPF